MGVLFSCPVDEDGGDISSECASLVAAAPVLKASLSSAGKLRIQGSLSFKKREQQQHQSSPHLETKISTVISPNSGAPAAAAIAAPVPMQTPRELLRRRFAGAAAAAMAETAEGPKQQRQEEEAAVRVQKVYKSFRTRRRLADCAVLVEQSWWELLDFALLRRSSVSFFDIHKPESAVSKWARAGTRAAKVGKGLSKDDKARKLALQHWLEAIDPRHRYGHNLHYYYDCWLRCESKEPFFYWLDVGEGKEINLEDRCARSKLLSRCIKYLGPKEREDYEVVIEDGEFMYKNSRQILDTSGGPRDAKWIFVLSTSRNLYVSQKKKGTFQHSSFLAGGATSAAGRLVVEDGILKAIWPHSGHYRPTEENFQEFQSFLKENNVDLSDVKMSPTEEDEEFWSRLRSIPSDRCTDADKPEEEEEQEEQDVAPSEETIVCQAPQITETTHDQALEKFPRLGSSEGDAETPSTSVPEDHQEEETNSNNDDRQSAAVAREKKVLERKASYQLLGKQPSFKWTTGAGPRIVCVRDCPPELQHRALEEVHLSPRSGGGRAASRFASPQRAAAGGGGSPMSRGCEPLTPRAREAFRTTHLQQQQGLLIW